ncbi:MULTISPECIES: acyltransferase [unclassified Mesorhizobium]|uniref:acyltransferase family protein n=1 Tax=unclassified Mesorhizobium TaxID=325217 RepID=UPI000BB02813|nr:MULTISPECIES: acyltransferase [unclassified Mesorhizobium]TGT59456.1 acyltransferase [Mesorhizobium sp. M00.F.Ca.ET.170.01.1.1]AZO12466.1 acyltransferase [Mesorhizobium sp. M3A.F.Ca.ET.080.04.2.1]PBB86071.1 acyltransferase [Mesorhizobium sp. WSM3876]RWB69366.1 MAG: acyltransferase [Mesorhizobium sp.]RWB85859.1 MAG: acyltransferase [Mesorhizobium sp.]
MTDISAASVVLPRATADSAARTRLAYLDGWRGLSIALVLIGHFFPVPGINLGVLGVEFFFVLSGRLMAEILFIERFPLKKFFKRRFSRIYPALLVFVIVAMIGLAGTFVAFKWKAALTALTFTYNYAGILLNRAGALDHIWSLCVEEHAYIILALVSVAVSGRANVVRLLVVLSALAMANGAVSYWVLGMDYETSYWRTDVHIASILLSAAICLLKADGRLPAFLKNQHAALAAAAGAILLFLDPVPTPVHYLLGVPLLALAVNVLDFANGYVTGLLSSRPMVMLGLWSYSLYLWQQPFYKFVYDRNVASLPMLAAVFACALCSYYIVEKPSRSWLNRNW